MGITAASTRRWRRWVWRGGVVVMVGCAASVLSAWIPAGIQGWRAVANTPPAIICESTPPEGTEPRLLLYWRAPAGQRWRTWAPDPPAASNGGATFVDEPAGLVATRTVAWPYYFPVPEQKPGFEIHSDAFGWPWMCMQRITTFQAMPDGSVQVDFHPSRDVWMFQVDRKWYMIPLRRIWPGLVANAAVFAALFGMVWMGPGVIRRAVRRAGGRCVWCGYSLVGSSAEKCPECGAAVEARAVG